MLMESTFSDYQINKSSIILDRANWDRETGANLSWMAIIHIYNGILMNSTSYIKEAFQRFLKKKDSQRKN